MVSCRPLGSSTYLAFGRSGGKFLIKLVLQLPLIDKSQMAGALMATGWWMYLDVPQTPNAVVLCVIIFNAAFGYRYLYTMYCGLTLNAFFTSWGPIPWLYPPEVSLVTYYRGSIDVYEE
jgi:hypothetical protein